MSPRRFVIRNAASDHAEFIHFEPRSGSYSPANGLSGAARFLTRHAAEVVKIRMQLPEGWKVRDLDKIAPPTDKDQDHFPF